MPFCTCREGVHHSAREVQDALEIELNKVHTWLLANKLTLNVIIGSRQRLSQVSVFIQLITFENCLRFMQIKRTA